MGSIPTRPTVTKRGLDRPSPFFYPKTIVDKIGIQMPSKPRWIDGNYWTCPRHLISSRFPKERETCYLSTCKQYCGGRPLLEYRPQPVRLVETTEKPKEGKCALVGCEKQKRPNSKYCSRKCNNRNANIRYRARKLEIKRRNDRSIGETGT